MKSRLSMALLGTTLYLQGCAPAWQISAPVTPSSYATSSERIPRTVGKLRKLVAVTITQPPPKGCWGGGGEIALGYDALGEATIRHLSDRKGYEMVRLEQVNVSPWTGTSSPEAQVEELVRAAAGTPETNPSELVRNIVGALARSANADGVILLRSHSSCLRANAGFRALIGILSLGVSEVFPEKYNTDAKPYPLFQATIFEGASGRIVWQQERHLPLVRFSESAQDRSDAELFFEDLEIAIPKVLTR